MFTKKCFFKKGRPQLEPARPLLRQRAKHLRNPGLHGGVEPVQELGGEGAEAALPAVVLRHGAP